VHEVILLHYKQFFRTLHDEQVLLLTAYPGLQTAHIVDEPD